MQVTMFDVKNELRNMGFSNSEDRHLMAVACTLYAEGVHKMTDVLSEMSNMTGLNDRNIRTKMDRALKSAWSREVHNPRKMTTLALHVAAHRSKSLSSALWNQ